MQFEDWINEVVEKGFLCNEYTKKINGVLSKRQLVDIVLDSNGASWLPELQKEGLGLPYETIIREFKGYINGRYIAEHKNKKSNGYTSSIYCCYAESDTINVNTTLTTLLGCSVNVKIRENDFVRLYVDKNCDITIKCPDNSRCLVDYWDGAKINVVGEGVELIKHSDER